MKLSKLKRLLNDIVDKRIYVVQRKCLLEDIVRYDGSNTCKDCKYGCFNKCTAVGMSVLK